MWPCISSASLGSPCLLFQKCLSVYHHIFIELPSYLNVINYECIDCIREMHMLNKIVLKKVGLTLCSFITYRLSPL